MNMNTLENTIMSDELLLTNIDKSPRSKLRKKLVRDKIEGDGLQTIKDFVHNIFWGESS